MGILRGGLLVVVSVILFLGLIIATSFFVVSDSLSYENVHEELVPVMGEVLAQSMDLDSVSSEKAILMQEYCVNQTEFVFSQGGETFTIPCSIISENSSAIIDEMITNQIDDIYYLEYDCGFVDCFEQQGGMPYFLISQHTKDYFEDKFYLLATFCLILSGGVFLLVKNKSNAPIIVGGLLFLSSLMFLKLDTVVGMFADKTIVNFFSFLFTSSYSIAIKGIIIAAILLVLGLIFKFFKIGFWFSDLMNKFRKNKLEETAKSVGKKEKGSVSKISKKKSK